MRAAMLIFAGLATLVFASTGAGLEHTRYNAYRVELRWQPNNPEAIAVKDALKTRFCTHFRVSPCVPQAHSPDGIRLISDLSVYVPARNLSSVALFFAQFSTLLSRINSFTSVKVLPLDARGLLVQNAEDVSGQFGDWDHSQVEHPSSVRPQTDRKDAHVDALGNRSAEPWTHTCTYADICKEPYVENTTCSGAVDAWHVHIFYASNDLLQVRARDVFRRLTTARFNMTWEDRCQDHQVEDEQDRLCWLTGPSGKDPQYPEAGFGGSFVTAWFSIYVPAKLLPEVLPWLMQFRLKSRIGADLDVLLHPETGCDWADHMFWPMMLGHKWDRNAFGKAMTAGSKSLLAPASDPRSVSYDGRPLVSCKDISHIDGYQLMLEYSSKDRQDALSALAEIKDLWQRVFHTAPRILDMASAAELSNSPCSGPCALIDFDPAGLGALLTGLAALRKPSLNFRVVPHGLGCVWREYQDFSLLLGSARLALNDFALRAPADTVQDRMSHHDAGSATTPQELPKGGSIVYVIGESSSKWSSDALSAFADLLAANFNTQRGECFPWLPELSSHHDAGTTDARICMMEEQWKPYMDPYAVFPTAFVPIYVPSALLEKVLPWVLRHRHADKVGYELDVAVAHLTGDPFFDYGPGLWWAGRSWKVNQYALLKMSDPRPAEQVRFYVDEDAQVVKEPGLVRKEWYSKSTLGELDLAFGDPSVTVLDASGSYPVSQDHQMRFAFDFQFVVLEGRCLFVAKANGSTNSTGQLEAGDMFWVRAGVPFRLEIPEGHAAKVMAVGGKWSPCIIESATDYVYNMYEDPNAQGPPHSSNDNGWFRSYKLSDQQWTPNPTMPSTLWNKGWDRSTSNNDDVAYLAVNWSANQWLPRHHHPTGAFYIVLEGDIHFPGEGTCAKFQARWSAPGHYYAGERSLNGPALITVLGTDAPPQFVDVPSEGQAFQHYLEEKRRNQHHAYNDPAAAVVCLSPDVESQVTLKPRTPVSPPEFVI